MPMSAVAVDGAEQRDVEEAEKHLGHVKDEDAAGGRDHAEAKLLGDFDQAGFVGEEQHEERAEGESDRLHGDAGITLLEERRDAAEHEAFEQSIDGRGDRRPFLFETGDHGEDKAADEADHDWRADEADRASA